MPVNDPIARPAQRSRHIGPAGIPGIGYRVILPNCVAVASLAYSDMPSGHVYLPIVVACRHLPGVHTGTQVGVGVGVAVDMGVKSYTSTRAMPVVLFTPRTIAV